MADEVEVPFDKSPRDQATLLLAAAEDLGLDADVVKTYEGGFSVPQEVHEKAYQPKKRAASKKSESKEG